MTDVVTLNAVSPLEALYGYTICSSTDGGEVHLWSYNEMALRKVVQLIMDNSPALDCDP